MRVCVRVCECAQVSGCLRERRERKREIKVVFAKDFVFVLLKFARWMEVKIKE